ncbi:unnamed protein product [Prorocentrum cordatum]|uniref:Uncharacterized protein n=1 Tax=Prorocentrum cordatum TaxID=2364126 RepID=A0ABN9QSK3_9DINO|nr:unnamed protein product [Polarella glacialis]
MLAYMAPARVARASDPAARAARERAAAEWKRAEAERLGIPWPRPRVHKRVGRPSRQEHFHDAIYFALGKQSLPEGLETADVPGWWERGMGLVRTVAVATEDMQQAALGGPRQGDVEADPWQLLEMPGEGREGSHASERGHAEEEGGALAGGGDMETPPKKKRKQKVLVPDEAKAWFLEYVEYQKKRYDWSMARSLRMAKELAPDIFRYVQKDTPFRWGEKRSVANTMNGKLSDVALTKLAEIAHATAVRVPVAVPVYRQIFIEQLRVMGIDIKVEDEKTGSWALAGCGSSFAASG